MTITELGDRCRELGLAITGEQLHLLAQYAELLKEWNAKINLISRKDEENILFKHVFHSLLLVLPGVNPHKIAEGARVLDLGTGGGLPGIPVKIVRPDLEITLCDSIAKKINACNDMIARLGLKNITAIVSRTEELPKQGLARSFDVIISRAVAPLDNLAKWTKELIKKNAAQPMLMTLKGGDLTEEIEGSQKLKIVASVENIPVQLPGFVEDDKRIVILQYRT